MIRFPDPELSDENGIVYVGGKLTVENLLNAYALGIFPWPHGDLPLLWFSPEERGIIDFKNFKIPRSVQRELKKKNFQVTFDQDFFGVIEGCAEQKRAGQSGTWITAEMMATYKKMFELGHAHSVECWSTDQTGQRVLAGGLYGVFIKNVFSGESMFFRESGASKAALVALIERLKKIGQTWLDIQMVTSVAELFGGEYIERSEFLERLKVAQKNKVDWSKI